MAGAPASFMGTPRAFCSRKAFRSLAGRQKHIAPRDIPRAGCSICRTQTPRNSSKGLVCSNGLPKSNALVRCPPGPCRKAGLQARAAESAPALMSYGDAATTVYIREPLEAGSRIIEPSAGVVVFGDVPDGAYIDAGGDVIIMGSLAGSVAISSPPSTASSSPPAVTPRLSALGIAPSASIAINNSLAVVPPGGYSVAGRGSVVAMLDPGGAVEFKTIPPGAALAPLAPLLPSGAEGPSLLGSAAGAVVLLLGLGLALAPPALFGGLLTGGVAESVAACLLETGIYGYLLLQGAGLLSDGSELLLEILDPGVIGGVVLPVLGALPDALIVLTSGAGASSKAAAQEQLAVGIGTLAGSTILLLSLAWGGSLWLGRCDLNPQGEAIDKTLTPGKPWQETGVTVDEDVKKGAAIMAASVLLYGSVQVPAFLGASEAPLAALLGGVTCLVAMVAYCGYSVISPELQKRRITEARKKRFRMYAVQTLARRSNQQRYGHLVDPDGQVNAEVLKSIFDEFDQDGNGTIEGGELQGLLLGLQLGNPELAEGRRDGTVDKATMDFWFKEFDFDANQAITYSEFRQALSRWIAEKVEYSMASVDGGAAAATLPAAAAAAGGGGSIGGGGTARSRSRAWSRLVDPQRTSGAAAALLADLPPEELAQLQATAAQLESEPADEAAEDLGEGEGSMGSAPLTKNQVLVQAGIRMAGGIALCALFSDPLVDALSNLSRVTGIPAFVVGFVLTPLASNSSEFVSSLRFAARKRRKNTSLTFSQVYGAVTMNNTLVLGLFLLVVYLQGLEWVYSSEVTVIVASTLAVGALGASRTTFTTKWALPAVALYPLSLLGVFVLDTFLGWQ